MRKRRPDKTTSGASRHGHVDRESIEDFAGRIASEYAPERIILFGSHASGRPRPDSDVDLFVIMSFEGRAIQKAVEILRKLNPSFAVDLVVRTPEDVEKRLRHNDFFVQDVLRHGMVLYEADHA